MVSLSRGGCCRSSCSCHHAEEPIGPSECVLSKAAEPAWDSTHSSAGGWRARIVGGGKQRTTRELRWGREVHATCGTCGACGVHSTRGTCARRAAERAACVPRVAHAPGRLRRLRCACHGWHVRQAGGGVCGVQATRGTCARRAAERAVCMPRVARAPGRGRSVRRTGHAWHMSQAGGGACGMRATRGT